MGGIALAAALGAWGASPGLASAAKDQGLFYEESGPIKVSWDTIPSEGVKVGICNAGPDAVTGLDPRPLALAFKSAERSKQPADVLKITAPSRLASGSCDNVVINRGAFEPDSAGYDGELLITSAGAGAIRRPLAVAGPGYLPPGTLKPARESTPFSATRTPLRDAELNADDLAIRDTASGTVPAKVLTNGEVVGRVYKDGFVAKVRIAGPASKPDDGQVRVPIAIEGADHVGTYSGSLDLTGDTKDSERVAITVVVKDALGWALLAIAAGVLLGLLPGFVRRVRILMDLKGQSRALEQTYESAEGRMHVAGVPAAFKAPSSRKAPSSPGKLDEFLDDFDKARKRYRRGAVSLDRKDKGYLRLKKMLKDAETDAFVLGATPAGLGPVLVSLRSQLLALDRFLTCAGWIADRPAFRQYAWRLLAGKELPVGGAVALKGKAAEHVALLSRWLRLGRQVSDIEEWSSTWMDQIDALKPADQERLAGARSLAAEARESLRHVTKSGDIDDDLASAIYRSHGALTYLGDRYETLLAKVETFDDDAQRHQRHRTEAIALASADSSFKGEDPLGPHTSSKMMAEGLPALPVPVGAVIGKGWRFILDWGVIVLAFAVAVVSSLSGFYFGKPWGTTVDYLTVIFVGTGSQIVLKALTDSLDSLRQSRLEPEEQDKEATANAASAPTAAS